MPTTKTIAIEEETKAALNALKRYPRETYDDVIRRLVEDERREAAGSRRAG